MREPTAEERAKERPALWTNLIDAAIVAMLIAMALVSGSLTMLSEAVRAVLLVGVSFYAWGVMWAAHRDRLSRFEYGIGKIEAFVWATVGASLVIAALWVAWHVVSVVFSSAPPASPLALSLAALVNGFNLAVNFVGWHAMHVAARGDYSGVFGAQLRARLTMLLSSLFLQATLTIAALAKDPVVALGLDAIGATYVVILMLWRGVPMVVNALPDLFDAPAGDEVKRALRTAAAGALPESDVVAIRTRRSGSVTAARLTIAAAPTTSAAALQAAAAAITAALRRDGLEVDVTLVPMCPPPAPLPEPAPAPA